MDQYLDFITNHYLLSFAFVVVSYLLIQELVESAFSSSESLSALLAVTRMNSTEVFVVDVREDHDFLKGHIEGAENIPLANLDEQLSSLEAYKNTELLVVCQTGTRTTVACKTLKKVGFEKLLSLKGGMQSWEDNKLPVKVSSKNK